MNDLSAIVRSVKGEMVKHSPEILTGIGVGGMVTTVILAVKATPKALYLIGLEEEELDVQSLTPIEKLRVAWKTYIPAAITGAASITCIISATKVNLRRNAALATAYSISESALREYREKVVETIGERKEREVRDAVAKDRINRDPVENREVVVTDKGNTLCYDTISGRYFRSDIDTIKDIVNHINRDLISDNYISLNEFYYELGLSQIRMGDDLGWNIDNGLLSVSYTSQLASDGTPCLVIDYDLSPRYDYRILQ